MILLDTNVLGRMTDAADPQCAAARQAVHSLLASHDQPVVVPQGLYEFWAVATRKTGSPPEFRTPPHSNAPMKKSAFARLPNIRRNTKLACTLTSALSTFDCWVGDFGGVSFQLASDVVNRLASRMLTPLSIVDRALAS